VDKKYVPVGRAPMPIFENVQEAIDMLGEEGALLLLNEAYQERWRKKAKCIPTEGELDEYRQTLHSFVPTFEKKRGPLKRFSVKRVVDEALKVEPSVLDKMLQRVGLK
jgi:hypothetical protein